MTDRRSDRFTIASTALTAMLTRCKKEARMCFLQHVNIVALLAIIFELGHYGIVMEYVLHGSFDEFMYTYDV